MMTFGGGGGSSSGSSNSRHGAKRGEPEGANRKKGEQQGDPRPPVRVLVGRASHHSGLCSEGVLRGQQVAGARAVLNDPRLARLLRVSEETSPGKVCEQMEVLARTRPDNEGKKAQMQPPLTPQQLDEFDAVMASLDGLGHENESTKLKGHRDTQQAGKRQIGFGCVLFAAQKRLQYALLRTATRSAATLKSFDRLCKIVSKQGRAEEWRTQIIEPTLSVMAQIVQHAKQHGLGVYVYDAYGPGDHEGLQAEAVRWMQRKGTADFLASMGGVELAAPVAMIAPIWQVAALEAWTFGESAMQRETPVVADAAVEEEDVPVLVCYSG